MCACACVRGGERTWICGNCRQRSDDVLRVVCVFAGGISGWLLGFGLSYVFEFDYLGRLFIVSLLQCIGALIGFQCWGIAVPEFAHPQFPPPIHVRLVLEYDWEGARQNAKKIAYQHQYQRYLCGYRLYAPRGI